MSLTVGSQQQVTTPLHQFYYVALLARGKAFTVLPHYRIQPELRNRPAFSDVHVGSLVGTFTREHEEPVAVGAEHGGAHRRPNVLSFCRNRRTASAHEGARLVALSHVTLSEAKGAMPGMVPFTSFSVT